MYLARRLKLTNGLIIFGVRPGMGNTRFTLKLANELATQENALFISYQEYKEHLEKLVEESLGQKQPNLTINSSFKFFDYRVFDDLKELLIQNSISTLIIDDLHHFVDEEHRHDAYAKDCIISGFKKLSDELNARIILNLSLSRQVESRAGDMRPMIRDFRWSRRIINDCDQIFAIYGPAYYGITEDEDGNPALNVIEVQCLKSNKGDKPKLILDNRAENILPVLNV